MGISQIRPITSLPVQNTPPQQQSQPPASTSRGGLYDSLGGEKKKRVEKEAGRSFSILDQLMSALGAFDAFGNNLAARTDPTMPALINTQLGNYANFQNAGGVNPNAILSGDFSGTNFLQPVSLDGQGPFGVPLQRPGGNPLTDALFNQLIAPAATGQISEIARSLLGFGSPNTNRTEPYSQADIEAIFSALGVPFPGSPAPAAPAAPVLDSYATGTPYVPQTGNYKLHQGEAVIPAQQNPANAPGGMRVVPIDTRAYSSTPFPAPGGQPAPALPPPATAQQSTAAPIDPNTGVYGGAIDYPRTPQAQPHTGTNPIQQSLDALLQMLGSGGPINQNVQNIQNQQVADLVSRGQQQQQQDLRANLGGRGLGGSGLQFALERDLANNAMQALTQGQNQVALDAAGRNWGAMQDVANSLIGGSLGAGQFGLQQAAFNLNQSQSMFDQLLDAIRRSFANPSDQYANTTNVALV